MRRFLIALMAVLALVAGPAFAQTFPPLTGRVVDDAHLLNPQQVAALDAKLAALEQQSQRQLVVATIPDLQGMPIEDYGYQLGRAWGLGDKQRNDGALLIVAPNERKVRIEVGYGLEGILTDALSQVIIQREIVPRFKQNDYAGGIDAAVDQLIAQLKLPDDEARKVAEQAQAGAGKGSAPRFDIGTVVFLVIFFLFFVLPFIRAMRGGGRRYGSSPGVMIFPGGGWGSGGGGSSWGGSDWGGGGGGGGFSGGGGSFGGGGASGDW
ncbi:methanol dehydrogenase [Novosphingobium sp. NBM11]|uniref:TPM domain-containing protein n=2 Tax=Novosphingobium TaxID=165696 RepID=UPI00061C8433|nr:TPM domain-containing protein [Novosphingobium sp. NBM11]MBF5090744.1 methanol dehydrogenase [Novosphingobium sp. NBM11]GAO54737.1 beta-propeller domains of methanol dehydrogenase type [Novosphingobium sp. MD-1]